MGDPLTVILKNNRSNIGARAETKVENGKDYDAKAHFIDRFMEEIPFIPIG